MGNNNFNTEIGIPTVPYEKKERMVTSEAESKQIESLARATIWIDTLNNSFIKVNEMFGTNISVDFDSAWKDNEIENEVAIEAMEMQGEGSTEQAEETDNTEAAPEDENVLIDETENEQTGDEEFEEAAAETEDNDVAVETDILPEIVEPIVEALEDIKDAIEGDEPAEEVKESDE